MVIKNKIIRDPIHGSIKIDGVFLELIESPEIQRLYNIKQLGFTHLVFPGAHHTRLEHCLGTYFTAYKAAENLNLKEEGKKIVTCAAILHDIGHGPFSHTLESILREKLNVDHVDLTKELISGKHVIYDEKEKRYIDSPNVFEILHKHNIDPFQISKIVGGEPIKNNYLSQLLNSSIDVDQLDYLIRDSYYTGVAYGMIDIERFLHTLTIKNDNLAVEKKGIEVVENILMARALMYSSVYFHKTVRIAELMLSKAIELIKDYEPYNFFKMTDAELMNYLRNKNGFQNEIATRLKFRNLFKQVYAKSKLNLKKDQINIVKKLEDVEFRRQKELEFEDFLDIPQGHIIIDAPFKEIHLSEPRIDKTDILIVEDKGVKKISEFTPIAEAIKLRSIPSWDIMIITDERYRDKVEKNIEKILYS